MYCTLHTYLPPPPRRTADVVVTVQPSSHAMQYSEVVTPNGDSGASLEVSFRWSVELTHEQFSRSQECSPPPPARSHCVRVPPCAFRPRFNSA